MEKIIHSNKSVCRDRFYSKYKSARNKSIPDDDRKSRAPYLKYLINKHFPSAKESRILDLGCGNGTLLYFLEKAGYVNIHGVDYSQEQTLSGASLCPGRIDQMDIFQYLQKVSENSFDVVVTFDLIEHLDKTELLKMSDEIYRILSKNGRWIVHTANAGALFGSRVRYADMTHELAFTKESLEQLATIAGFEKSFSFEDQPVIHNINSGVRWIMWRFIRVVLRLCWLAETGSPGRDCIFSQNLLFISHKS